ncbi:transmembrane protein 80 isoform X2 [Astyanax mexicanus]|uniref:Transmembrane protein 80 n=1 Tax=Astyanax mexicanus TaxID=7994 RepID=A0A8B9L7Z1_ASTMX|nr:transmembrane protein 80 isoform X2 [Astyanax mexicanus]
MAIGRAGRHSSVLSSVLLQILLYLSSIYGLFYFISSLCLIIYKSQVLSYPDSDLALDVCLLLLMAGLDVIRLYWGVRGNLLESEKYVSANLFSTGATVLLAVYFLVWQSYVLRADVIINSILLCLYGLAGVVGFGALARFNRAYS